MRFTKTVVALVAGALIFGPTTSAFAAEAEAEPQTTVTLEEAQTQEGATSSEGTEDSAAGSGSETAEVETGTAKSQADTAEIKTGDAVTQPETGAVAKDAAVSISSVKISGSAKVGKKLTAKSSVSAPSGVKVTKTYTWYANGKKVGTGSKYKVTSKNHGKRIRLVATAKWSANATYAAGEQTAKSAKTAKVVKQKASVKVGLKVKGTYKVGKKLTAKAAVKKPSGLKVKGTYTWYVGGKKVKTGKTLKLKSAHAGHTVKVVYKAKWKSSTYKAGSKKKTVTKKLKSTVAAKMVKKAKSQLGVHQDCTALVEKSLRAAGVKAGDLGTQTAEYTRLGGKKVKSMKAGDVIVWQGRHVAVYIGNGKAVHGGYNGTTKVASAYIEGTPSAIVRFA